MAFEIEFTATARDHLDELHAYWRAQIKDQIKTYLLHQPMQVSKSRIKRLRELDHPQYRLRIEDYRVFYDVDGNRVTVLAILAKDVAKWIFQFGERSHDDSFIE
jgi:mRNA interferase RelE/StbE